MKDTQINCVGVTYKVATPETVEEFDSLAGKAGAALASATANVVYRSTNAAFRAQFAEAVEAETGIERKTKAAGTKKVTDADGNEVEETVFVYDGTEKTYIDGVYEELDLDTPEKRQEYFAVIIAEVEAKLSFDPSGREPSAGKTKRAKKAFRDKAEAIFAKFGQEKIDAAAAALSAELDLTVDATTEGVALGLQIRDDRRDVLSEILG